MSEAALVIDSVRHEAWLDGVLLPLTPVEFRLLLVLHEQRGRPVSRRVILARLYDDHRVVEERTVDGHVMNVRHKLRAVRRATRILRAIYGVGYVLDL